MASGNTANGNANGTQHPANSYIVVGSGVFGASTARELSRLYPSASIKLIDRTPFPVQAGASWDLNKMVRADYPERLYMSLALEAKKLWATDPVLKPFYHQDGMFWVAKRPLGKEIMDGYKALGADEDVSLVPVAEAKKLYGGLFADADYEGVTEVLVNKSSGWAEARDAVEAVIKDAVNNGVEYVASEVEKLTFDASGRCTGCRVADGREFKAEKTVLCVGAQTAKVLADSAPERKELQAGDRLMAHAICSGVVQLDAETAKKFQGPCCCHEAEPVAGGSLPPTKRNELKCYMDITCANTIKHFSGQNISVPPKAEDYNQWNVPQVLQEEIRAVFRAIYGSKLDGYPLTQTRICWDSLTPSEDFIICAPPCEGLYIGCGGSTHGWKFLPVLGKYIVQMMEGRLDEEKSKLWGWERKGFTGKEFLFPKRELRDLV